MKQEEKIVLGFSGGLDTSYCCARLSGENKFVLAVLADTGGFSPEDILKIEQQALKCGAGKFVVIDAAAGFYKEVIRFLIFGNCLKNDTYPLSVSAERTHQALALANFALETNATGIAHGSTGAGNDQVRFDLVFNALCPDMKIITPVRDRKLSRKEEVAFLVSRGIETDLYGKPWSETAGDYSINKGLWGTSIGGRETLISKGKLPESAWPSRMEKSEPEEMVLEFEKGELVSVNGISFADPVAAIRFVEKTAAPFGIGRDVHVGDTIIGIKGRVAFEAPAPLIIIKAHHLLEKHVLSKQQLCLKDQVGKFYAGLLHEAQLLDPVMRDIEAFLISTQEKVSGKVFLELHPWRFFLTGISSPFDLMQTRFGSYGETNKGFSGEDVKGFTAILGNQIRMACSLNNSINEKKEVYEA